MTFTVLIPVFNTPPNLLMEAVYNVLDQDDKEPHRIIVIDDCSTRSDTIATLSILSQLSDRIAIMRLPENKGTSAALNAGHGQADTEYVALMGSDDICDRSRFRLQAAYLDRHPETDVLGTALFAFYDHDITRKSILNIKHPEKAGGTFKDQPNFLVNHGTVVYRNKAVIDIGGYDEGFRRGQDVQLWARMKRKGYIFRNIETVLYGWRRYKK